MKMFRWKSLIITQTIIVLFMVVPSQGMLYRALSRRVPIYQKPLQKNAKNINLPQKNPINKPKLIPPKKQRFSFDQSDSTSKKSWGALLAAIGLGWIWYNKENDEEKKEEKSEKQATEKYIGLDQFITKFTPPKEIQETIEEHKDALAPRRIKPYFIEGTQPPIYHKWDDIDRIINAELLREVIKQNNLDIEIPKKYVYPNPNNGKYEVFAQGIPVRPLGNEELTLKEIQALIKLTMESGYTDFSKDNLFRNSQNNKLVIVDTENASFLKQIQFSSTGWGHTVNAPKAIGIRSMIDHLNRDFKMDKDAHAWAVNYAKKLKESEEGQEIADLYSSRYNTLNISAQNAKELERELKGQNQGQEGFAAQAFWLMKHALQSKKQ